MAHTTRMGLIGRRTRGMVGMLLLAGAVVSGGSSAQAAGGPGVLEPGRYRMAYESATVSSMAPGTDGSYHGDTVSVFRHDQGTQLCVSSTQPDAAGGVITEAGCSFITDTAFTLEKKLATATLAPSTVTLFTYRCNEFECSAVSSRDVEVAATFTGVGAVQTTKSRSSYSDGTYTYQFKGSGSFRDASGSFTIDGEAQSGAGSLTISKNLTVVRAN